MAEYFKVLLTIGFASCYLPFMFVIISLLKNHAKRSSYERLFFFYISYSGIATAVEQFVLYGHINNFHPFHNILTILDFCIIAAIFTKILQDADKKLLKILTFIILIFPFFSIAELLFVNDLFSFNIYSNNISKFLIIIIASITIYLSEIKIEISTSQKIVVYTLFIYNILTLPITLSEQIIRHEKNEYLDIIWSLNILFAILYNLFLTLSLWKLKK
jgi:hypothetical protein